SDAVEERIQVHSARRARREKRPTESPRAPRRVDSASESGLSNRLIHATSTDAWRARRCPELHGRASDALRPLTSGISDDRFRLIGVGGFKMNIARCFRFVI